MVGILNIQAGSSDTKRRARLQASNDRNISSYVKRVEATFGGHSVILPDYQGTT